MASEIITADGRTVAEGDRVFNYYDGKWGVIEPGSVDDDGWFTHASDDGSRSTLNGERVAVELPSSNPFYETWREGRETPRRHLRP